MNNGFLVYLLISIIPIALIGIGGRTEHVLFVSWRWVQVVALFAVSALLLYRTIRSGWRDLVVLVLVAAALAYLALGYTQIAWDAQIEYHRVIMLANSYGSLTEGYKHGITNWILGYPPGTSLSIMFYSTLRMPSANIAQNILALIWSASFMQRHMRDVDLAGKLAFFVLLAVGEHSTWHFTFFYNNLFYALVWAELVLAPLFGSSFEPWERCACALVLIALRPQWQIAAIPIGTSALSTLLTARTINRRLVRDLAMVTMAALCVAWLGSSYWREASTQLNTAISQEKLRALATTSAGQDARTLHVEVETNSVTEQRPPVPALLSKPSFEAVAWAFAVSYHAYRTTAWTLALAALFALIVLRRRGLAFVVPLLSPLALVAGTAVFARSYPEYRANEWALERLQIITPFLAAGVLAALHRAIRRGRVD